MHYWLNKLGDFYMTKHRYFIGCLRPNFFQMVPSWRQPTQAQLHMLGVVYSEVEKSSKEEQYGGLGMEGLWIYGRIIGCLENTPQGFYPLSPKH